MLAVPALLGGLFSSALAELAIATAGAYLLFGFAKSARAGVFSRINNLNDISYGVYLYAWPITQLLLWRWPAASLPALVLATIGGALLCGWLSWHLVEKPAMRRLR